MTKLTPANSVVRETAVLENGDPIIVELFPRWVELRLKGKKARTTLTYEEIMRLGRRVNWVQRGGGQ